ncbi:unnamed protein product [Lampetra planeri]
MSPVLSEWICPLTKAATRAPHGGAERSMGAPRGMGLTAPVKRGAPLKIHTLLRAESFNQRARARGGTTVSAGEVRDLSWREQRPRVPFAQSRRSTRAAPARTPLARLEQGAILRPSPLLLLLMLMRRRYRPTGRHRLLWLGGGRGHRGPWSGQCSA